MIRDNNYKAGEEDRGSGCLQLSITRGNDVISLELGDRLESITMYCIVSGLISGLIYILNLCLCVVLKRGPSEFFFACS